MSCSLLRTSSNAGSSGYTTGTRGSLKDVGGLAKNSNEIRGPTKNKSCGGSRQRIVPARLILGKCVKSQAWLPEAPGKRLSHI